MKRLNKGSALLVTLLIMVILTLTGISFLFMADTENKISNNYYLAMRALLAAQSGVYMVNSWFNYAKDTLTLLPSANDIQFNPRQNTSDGTNSNTLYKWGCQAPNANCSSYKLFDRPFIGINYTPTVYQRFFGTSQNPDILISYKNNKSVNYLNNLNTLLLGSATGPIRISEIKLYSPPVSPYADDPTDTRNTPYGICTAEITAETVRRDSSGNVAEVLSTRRVRGIITDVNFAIAGVAFDVDGIINQNGAVRVWWGTMKSTKAIYDNNVQHLGKGAPWYVNLKGTVLPCGTLFGTTSEPSQIEGVSLEDPWFLLRSRYTLEYQKKGLVIDSCTGISQAIQVPGHELLSLPLQSETRSCDYIFNDDSSLIPNQNIRIKYSNSPGGIPYIDCKECNGDDDSPTCGINTSDCVANVPVFNANKYYNIIGCDPTVGFANAFRGYNYWKNVITTVVKQGGGGNIYYLVPGGYPAIGGVCSSGLWGRPNDGTDCKDFESWTSGKSGFWFFDTNDGKYPRMDAGNIISEVSVKGKYWSEGFQYICAQLYDSAGGATHDFEGCRFPGEPLWENQDPHYKAYRDGKYSGFDSDGNFIDRFLNLRYPANKDFKSTNYVVDATAADANLGTTTGWDEYGPTFTFRGYFKGIMYLTGKFWARGNREFYGSVMIWDSDSRSAGNVEVWYNPELKEGITQNLPTAYVEQIITDM